MSTEELTRPARLAIADSSTEACLPLSVDARRYGAFELLQSEIDRVLEAFHRDSASFMNRGFRPRMEITETDATLEIAAELPGMDRKDVEINIADGVLTIRGEKKFEKDEKRKNYRMVERSYGTFERQIALPHGVDAASVKATLRKGLLVVEVVKPAAEKVQAIRIATE